jgi:hypothetical protein
MKGMNVRAMVVTTADTPGRREVGDDIILSWFNDSYNEIAIRL